MKWYELPLFIFILCLIIWFVKAKVSSTIGNYLYKVLEQLKKKKDG